MKKTFSKIIALLVAISMLMSLSGCSTSLFEKEKSSKKSSHSSKKDKDKDDDDEDEDEDDDEDEEEETGETDETEETDETDPDFVEVDLPTEVTFEIQPLPTESYSYEKVHPYFEPGDITGDEAVELLNEIELDVLRSYVDNYVDADLLLEDSSAFGFEFDEISFGNVNLDEVTEEDMEEYFDWLDQLKTIDYESLEENDRLLYDKLVFDLEEDIYFSQFTEYPYMTCVFNSFTSVQCDIFFVLDVMSFDTIEDAENYILVLESLEQYFGDLCTLEETRASMGYAASDANYDGVVESFDNLVAQKDDCFLYESFENRLDNIEGITDDEKADLIERHEAVMKDVVFPTFQDCADRIEALKGNCVNELGLYYYEGGTYLYEDIVRMKSNSQMTPTEAGEILDEQLAAIFTLLMTANYDMNYDLSVGDVQQNLDFLSGIIYDYFPEVPDHEYQLREVPEVFADSFSPAAYLGFHLDNYDSNMILINTAKDSDSFGTVVAHEGYPGHMYQSLYTRMVATHPYLVFTGSSGYKEGWAQYVELYSVDFFDCTEEQKTAYYINTLLNVVLMGRIDVGVNYEGWDAQDVADHINGILGMNLYTADVFEEIVDICIVDPGYPLPYALGYYNTDKILSNMFAEHPELTEKEIFEVYLNAQTVTFEQIEDSVDRQLA